MQNEMLKIKEILKNAQPLIVKTLKEKLQNAQVFQLTLISENFCPNT
jgi:hypothetical protein